MNPSATLSAISPERFPVSIITGFLGSGKTTLLNYLVQQNEMGKVAVLINEFGEIGLDHLLVETISDEIMLLQSGCICCQMNGDFVSTLIELHERRVAGDVEAFTHVLVETTGVADPAPIIRALLSNRKLMSHYRLGSVVATVDTVLGESQLLVHREVARQISLADKLLFCKVDLSDQAQRDSLTTIVRKLNPRASISEVTGGVIACREVFLHESRMKERDPGEIEDWLGQQPHAAAASNSHSGAIHTFSIAMHGTLEWDNFVAWIDALLTSRSRQILRIKGLLNIRGKNGPIVIQAVQNMLYPPVELAKWPGTEQQSVIVFITCDLSQVAVEKSLSQFFPADVLIAAGAADNHAQY